MTTLLTKGAKKKLKKDYFIRFIVVVLNLMVLLMVIWLVLTWALSLVLNTEKKSLDDQIDQSNQKAAVGFLNKYKEDLGEVEDQLILFDSKHVSKSEIIDFLYSVKPNDISFETISVIEEKSKIFVSIVGLSDSRDILIFFKNLVEKNDSVENFDLPLSSFAKNEEITFTMTFTYKEQ
jgi:hypothetical protein